MILKLYQRKGLRKLREKLDAIGMRELLSAYGNEEERGHIVAFDLPLLPEPLETLCRFLIVGEPITVKVCERLLSSEALDTLVSCGLAVEEGDVISLLRHRLVNHLGLLIFCHKRSSRAKLYYGNDSLALGRILLPVSGHALDVCTGVGTQALICAQTATAVTAVEKDPAVEPVFRVNAELNGSSGKVDLLIGDLIEPVRGQRFDRITCNPPLLPIPPTVQFPDCANGGTDGMEIVERLLKDIPEVLARQGRCQMIGTILGDKDGPNLKKLKRIAKDAGLRITLVLPCREPLEPDSPIVNAMVATAADFNGGVNTREAFLKHFGELGATHLYSFILSTTLSKQPTVAITQHYLRNSTFWAV